MKRFLLTPQKLPRLTENDVERACLDLLRIRQWYPIRLHVGRFKTADHRWITIGELGTPDYVALHALYPAILLECKRPGRKASPAQVKKQFALHIAYGLAVTQIDDARMLSAWLDDHERRSEDKWRKQLAN